MEGGKGDLNIYMYIHTSTHVRPSVLDHPVQLIVYSETGEPSRQVVKVSCVINVLLSHIYIRVQNSTRILVHFGVIEL